MTSPHGEGTGAGGGDLAAPGARVNAATPNTLTPDAAGIEQLVAEWEADKPPAAGPAANVAAAVVVGAIGIAGIVGSLALGLGTPADPHAGMWPFIVCVILVLLAVALAVVGRGVTDAEKFSHQSWAVLGGLVSLIALVMLIPVVGFEIPSLLLTFIWLRFLGKESWKMSTILSVVIVAAFYGIFVLLLGVSLPHLF
ncbi:tripartite tricarboxylate transporter TctB family protein [Salinibacterium sp. ZJ454]|uniref:tripartite tricarboxylate transporter TctB family protein n=1 Tax=Salinibacterium sp. ZJ454 TaxID=2708339 RepID=UPI001FBB44F0|nr:tripartite tricarboxylate transporter TctB family protein [Salinibacterium sp. ZJ454]